MSTRYITGALLAIAGGLLVVISQALASTVLGWVAFGVAVGVIAISALAQLDRARGGVQRVLDGATAAVAGLLMAFSVAASGAAVVWLSFAFALGIVGLAFTGLSVHEVANWRAQRRLSSLHWLHESKTDTAPDQYRAA
jgi:hypothetical protein